MAQDIAIAGAVFNAVPSILVPTSGGGTAVFADPSVTTAEASDVASGKLFLDALGVLTSGTASGGGGGLEYEEGRYTPTTDIARPTISFSKAHTSRPICVLMIDIGTTAPSTNSNLYFVVGNWYDAFATSPSSVGQYARIQYAYKNSNGSSASGAAPTSTGSTAASGLEYWVTNTEFKPYSGSMSRCWRAGRTYKWIAVWKP